MSARAKILERLTRSKNLSVERMVALALAEGGRGTKGEMELAQVLFDRGTRAARVELVRVYDRLGVDVRKKLLADPRELYGPLSEAMQDIEGAARGNVIEIVRQSGDLRLTYLLVEALNDARPEVRELAGISLLGAVRRYQDRSATCVTDGVEEGEVMTEVQKAVMGALKHFRTHKQATTVIAAMLFERQQDSAMWSFFCDPHDELTKAATVILRNPPGAVAAGMGAGMLLALATTLKPAAMAGLAGTEDAALGRAMARESFRLLDPVLREAAQGIAHVRVLGAMWKESPPNEETWSHWLRLIDAVGLQGVDRIMWLGRLLERASSGLESNGGCVAWKMSVMRSVEATGTVEAGRILSSMLADADERVARVAARYMLSKKRPEWRALAASTHTPHLSVRRMVGMAGGEGAGRSTSLSALVASAAAAAAKESTGGVAEPTFGKVWNEYPKMPPVVQGKTTRASADADPQFVEQLKGKLASAQTLEVAQGLKMLGTLADLRPYRGQIIGLCGHKDVRVASVAVKLVGRLADPRLKDLLEAAAQHADQRVRANAIEAMGELHIAKSSQQVLAMLNSRHNRERANAIHAISEFDFVTARDCLARMLGDPNPLHRMSALWVVEQLQLTGLFRQVSSVGRRDPNLRVRKRAAEIVDSLTGQVIG